MLLILQLSVFPIISGLNFLSPKLLAQSFYYSLKRPREPKNGCMQDSAITMLSAFLAHICSGDPLSKVLFVGFDSLLFGFAVWTVHRYEDSLRGQQINEKLVNAKP
jgi:hypothetical protein